jgi:hypothetical protein
MSKPQLNLDSTEIAICKVLRHRTNQIRGQLGPKVEDTWISKRLNSRNCRYTIFCSTQLRSSGFNLPALPILLQVRNKREISENVLRCAALPCGTLSENDTEPARDCTLHYESFGTEGGGPLTNTARNAAYLRRRLACP